MNTYIFLLISVSIASAISLYLLSGTFATPILKTLCSLCVLLSILKIFSPLFDTITDLAFEVFDDKTEVSPDDYNEEIINETGRYICNYTKQLLTKKFQIKSDDFFVSAQLSVDDELNAELTEIIIEFLNEPSISKAIMTDYIENTFLCRCMIITPD